MLAKDNKCFKLERNATNWQEAQHRCELKGGHLAIMDHLSTEWKGKVTSWLRSEFNGSGTVWVGAYAARYGFDHFGKFVWLRGQFHRNDSVSAVRAGNTDKCVHYSAGGADAGILQAQKCWKDLAFLCEIEESALRTNLDEELVENCPCRYEEPKHIWWAPKTPPSKHHNVD